jgi:hypothetical protein
MHQTLATPTPTPTPSTHAVPRVFPTLERLCRVVATPGGRILVLVGLVIAGYAGAAMQIPFGEHLGAAALIALLLVLARHPSSPGFLGAILAMLKK